ncbi:MAG TPA: DUF4279 domain-containing protein [Polyangiaceae bacterium]|nr:DUF4279 domain-containing protein [Polyangiaceae bacterium]
MTAGSMHAPLKRLGGPVLSSNATLRVQGANLKPQEFTALVGVEPSHAHARGDMVSPRVKRVRKEGLWMLDSQALPAAHPEEHITGLLGRLPQQELWLRATQGARVDLIVSLTVASDHEAFSVSAPTLGRLGELGIELGFEIWPVSNESEPESAT